MGQRPAKATAKTEPKGEPTPSQGRKEFQVDASKIIARLQQQRAELEAHIDVLSVALEEAQEREAAAVARIAELEDN